MRHPLTLILILVFALCLAGCGSKSKSSGDDDVSGDDTSGDDSGSDDAGDDSGDWYDSSSGLTWQGGPSAFGMVWNDANIYCANLGSGWRLPTISELRGLIRGCSATQTGGSCGVTDSCRSDSACRDSSCQGCADGGGPASGCYWPSELSGDCVTYWSSSLETDYGSAAWAVGFSAGMVNMYTSTNNFGVRCVR